MTTRTPVTEAMFERTTMVEISATNPMHSVREEARLAALVRSMGEADWEVEVGGQHSPLVGYEEEVIGQAARVQLITGSHRYEAAKLLGYEELPVVLLTEDELAVARASNGWDSREDSPRDSVELGAALARAGYAELGALLEAEGWEYSEKTVTVDHGGVRYTATLDRGVQHASGRVPVEIVADGVVAGTGYWAESSGTIVDCPADLPEGAYEALEFFLEAINTEASLEVGYGEG